MRSRRCRTRLVALLMGVATLLSTGLVPALGAERDTVDDARLAHAEQDRANWLTYGRTYSEQRYSPLRQISVDNVSQLGLAWFADLDTNRGQEATPLVIDGSMYVSTAWSICWSRSTHGSSSL
jgi:quinohemoprotein ethanol dehydrogenase